MNLKVFVINCVVQ